MLANVVIVSLIVTYSIYVIFKVVKDFKEGRSIGCAGCSSCGGNCAACRENARKLEEFRRLKKKRNANLAKMNAKKDKSGFFKLSERA